MEKGSHKSCHKKAHAATYFENFLLQVARRLASRRDHRIRCNSLLVWRRRQRLDLLNVSRCRRARRRLCWQRREADAARDGHAWRHLTSWRCNWSHDFSHLAANISRPVARLQLVTVHQSTGTALEQSSAEHAHVVEAAVGRMWKVAELLRAAKLRRRGRRRSLRVKAERAACRARSRALISFRLCTCEICGR